MEKLMLSVVAVVLWACGGAEEDASPLLSKVRVPLEIDGARYSPQEAENLFGGQVVSFFIDEEAQRQGFAYAFTSAAERDAFLQKWELEHPPEVQAQSVTDSVFYEHAGAGGDSFTLPQYTAEPDLTRRGCFLRVKCNLWNDRISSVTPSRTNRYTMLYEHINYGGRSLWLSSGVGLVELSNNGFNDMTSSISYAY